jgi:hypothetical protein
MSIPRPQCRPAKVAPFGGRKQRAHSAKAPQANFAK